MKRRKFLATTSTAVSVPLLLRGMPVQAVEQSSIFNFMNTETDRVLVLINLNGGNDGLNMLLPLDQYDKLANNRSNVLYSDNAALQITDNAAFHPEMSGAQKLFDEGRLSILQSVAYPNQNRSHFRSTDIWTTGSPADEFWTTGWLGRFLELSHASFPEGYPNAEHPDPLAMTMDSFVSETCQGTVSNFSLAVTDPFSLGDLATGGEDEVPDTPYGDELEFLRTTIAQTNAYSDTILAAADLGNNLVDYPSDNRLAQQLKNIALLISGGLKTKIYVANLGGFDTHANQVEEGDPSSGVHAELLRYLSDAMEAFQNDLEALGLGERVLTMTFSEFGRRILSNSSFGTDHGTAAPLMVMGSCVNPGILGDSPEIPEVAGTQDGVVMQYDFRNVYGSILMDWFEVEENVVQQLLFQDFAYIPILDVCGQVNQTTEILPSVDVDLQLSPNPFRDFADIAFTSERERVRVSVFNAMGHELEVLMDKNLAAGEHRLRYDGRGLSPGVYYIRIQLAWGRQKTKAIVRM